MLNSYEETVAKNIQQFNLAAMVETWYKNEYLKCEAFHSLIIKLHDQKFNVNKGQ